MQTYNRLEVAFERGEGPYLYDTSGRRYLDALAGIAVCGLGHAHPAVAEAVADQAARLIHTSNLYDIPLQRTLAAKLVALSGMTSVFFCNSGTEAAEAAIKLARRHGHERGIDAPVVVAAKGAFHGRTMGALSATGSERAHAGFEPLLPGFVHVPYGDLAALTSVLEARDDVAAVMLEPVQGENGVVLPPEDFLGDVRRLTEAHDVLMVVDEVQTGMGRTGAWFAHQHDGIVPDVMTLAKALGNGVPIGAMLAHGDAAALLAPGQHGSTFGGNPLAARAALAVIETLEREDLVAHAAAMGERLKRGLSARLAEVPGVVEVRGRGLMIGVELDRPCGEIVRMALAEGVLVNVTAGNRVRLLPPLIVREADVDRIVDVVADAVERFVAPDTAGRAVS